MYERFTDRARKAMQVANQEAQRFNQEYVGTEHILLGVLQNEGVATAVLKNLDVDRAKIRLDIEKLVERGPEAVTMGKLPQTPRAKKVIEFAMLEARNLKHNYVGDEHLLLGLLREAEGIAANVLANNGLKLTEVREEILNLLGHGLEPEPGQRLSEAEVLTRERRERVTRLLSRILCGKVEDNPHRFHPVMRPWLDQIQILDRQKREAASNFEFETAAELRDRQQRVQKISTAHLERLADGDEAGNFVERLCFALSGPPEPFVRETEARQVVELLADRATVLVVAPRGAGKFVLFQAAAQMISQGGPGFEGSAPTVVHPNFLHLRQESRFVNDVPLQLMQQLLRGKRHVLVVSGADACCSYDTSSATADAWKRAY